MSRPAVPVPRSGSFTLLSSGERPEGGTRAGQPFRAWRDTAGQQRDTVLVPLNESSSERLSGVAGRKERDNRVPHTTVHDLTKPQSCVTKDRSGHHPPRTSRQLEDWGGSGGSPAGNHAVGPGSCGQGRASVVVGQGAGWVVASRSCVDAGALDARTWPSTLPPAPSTYPTTPVHACGDLLIADQEVMPGPPTTCAR